MILVNSPLSSLTPNERKENAAWKKNTKYRSRVSFWKNNHYVRVKITEDNQYIIHSMKKSHKRQYTYDEIIKEFIIIFLIISHFIFLSPMYYYSTFLILC